jgi:hypothetical protein
MTTKTIYWTMVGSMALRLFWLSAFEPKGSRLAILNHPDNFIVHTLPYVVYPSLFILIIILLFTLLKKPWAYMAGMIFGLVHLILVLPLVILKLHPGMGPLIVIPACVLMIIFSYLSYKKSNELIQMA